MGRRATQMPSGSIKARVGIKRSHFRGLLKLSLNWPIHLLICPPVPQFRRIRVPPRPRELTGAVDLMSHFKLLPHHEFFCKWTLPISISDTRYLHNVVGDTKIRKGEGMQLDQLIQNASNSCMQQFELDVLRDAFQLKETTPINLPPGEKGMPTVAGKFKSESKDKERKHKKHKERDKENDKEHTKHKHHHKDKDQNNDKHKQKKKNRSGHLEFTAKQHEKKRKHDGDEDPNDVHRHRKSIRAQKWMKLVS